MKKLATAIVLLCFFAGQNVQAEEVNTKAATDNSVELVADSKTAHVAEPDELAAQINEKAHDEMTDFFDRYISGRLQIGTRMATRTLTDSDSGHEGGTYGSGTYLGTIYAIDEIQDYVPSLFFLKYFFTDYFAVELAYDSVQGETEATINGYGNKSDGDITMSGPTINLVAHYPNSTKFSPYVSFGVGFYSGDFDESANWALGYSSQEQYEAYGSTGTVLNGRTREMAVDDEIGILFGLGCTYAVTDNWLIDLSMQYTQLDPDATFYGYTYGELDTEQDGHFPMDNVAFRLGLAYQF